MNWAGGVLIQKVEKTEAVSLVVGTFRQSSIVVLARGGCQNVASPAGEELKEN